MFGIFKGEFSAVFNLECKKANTNLPNIRLRKISERNNYGLYKSSVKRTVPSDLFDCCKTRVKHFVFNYLEIKKNIFRALAQFLLKRNSLKNMRKLCQD